MVKPKPFFLVSVLFLLAAMIGLSVFHDKTMIYACIALIGLGNSNVFSIIFSQALFAEPEKLNYIYGR